MKKLIASVLTVMLSITGSAYAAEDEFDVALDVGSYTTLEEGCAYEVSDESAVVLETAFGSPAYKFIKVGHFTIKHYHNGDYSKEPDVWKYNIVPPGEGFGIGKIETKVETIVHHVDLTQSGITLNSQETTNESSYIDRVLELVNIERGRAGVAPLRFTNELLDAAAIRAEEITRYYSHTRPNGQPHSSLIRDGKYTVGENIAAGYTSPESVVKGWMDSPGHRANILNPDYNEIGVGYAYSDNGEYNHYWVQVFKRPLSKAYR